MARPPPHATLVSHCISVKGLYNVYTYKNDIVATGTSDSHPHITWKRLSQAEVGKHLRDSSPPLQDFRSTRCEYFLHHWRES